MDLFLIIAFLAFVAAFSYFVGRRHGYRGGIAASSKPAEKQTLPPPPRAVDIILVPTPEDRAKVLEPLLEGPVTEHAYFATLEELDQSQAFIMFILLQEAINTGEIVNENGVLSLPVAN